MFTRFHVNATIHVFLQSDLTYIWRNADKQAAMNVRETKIIIQPLALSKWYVKLN